jgi:putative membrane protein
MRASLYPAAAALLLSFCSPANDRRADETGRAGESVPEGSAADTIAPTDTGAYAGSANATTPAAILSQMNVANTAEIQTARYAAKHARSPAVKRIANQLAEDHSKNRDKVRSLARQLDVPLTPAAGGDLSASDSLGLPPDLQGRSAAELDRAFIEGQIEEHQGSIAKIEWELLPTAQNQQVKVYLEETVKDMRSHLASLQEVRQQLAS